MDRAFQTEHDATVFVHETLEELARDGDHPTYQGEVETDLGCWYAKMYDFVKAIKESVESMTIGEVSELEHMVMWRDALCFLGEERITTLITEYLPTSPATDLEQLIRTIGMGYHPDTPYYGYEPPIYSYTEAEWNAIHARFLETRGSDDDDIYEFGLGIFNEMELENKPTNGATRTGRDGIQQYWATSLDKWVTIPED